MKIFLYLNLLVLVFIISACDSENINIRNTISLNGDWEIAESNQRELIPSEFNKTVIVPGLIDMTKPDGFDSIGYATNKKRYFWYKKTINLDSQIHETAILKVYKAKYTMGVFINGEFAGEYNYNFTPGIFDVKKFLKAGQSNEFVIRISTYDNAPDSVQAGHDFEKLRYIPGIYDNVELILSGSEFIENLQIAPDIYNKKIKVVAKINSFNENSVINYVITEYKSGKKITTGASKNCEFEVTIPNCNYWSPENPFLYKINIYTNSDSYSTRFGMREFKLDPGTGKAYLNGKPYFMRGTNVCILRFFEDSSRGVLPWEKEWVKNLHRKFKTMHWNSIRYCIGFPPELWYEIADEEGFLIQDEYPVWYSTADNVKEINPDFTALANEYKDWMKERWNHPCVVIWDGQNETVTPETGKAIQAVRGLDLSDRPWDNGWSAPMRDNDVQECHPYLYYNFHDKNSEIPKGGLLKFALDTIRIPDNGPSQRDPLKSGEMYKNPIIINEFAWLWLNRDGSPTQLTQYLYTNAFGETTLQERYEIYARHLSMKTEYWRAHQKCAGIMYFCGLGYSRPEEPKGQTSDNFIDIENLIFEPTFEKYMKDAFSPVGIMLDFWESTIRKGDSINFNVIVTNDTYTAWHGNITLLLANNQSIQHLNSKQIDVQSTDSSNITFPFRSNDNIGKYKLIVQLIFDNDTVQSIRDIEIKE